MICARVRTAPPKDCYAEKILYREKPPYAEREATLTAKSLDPTRCISRCSTLSKTFLHAETTNATQRTKHFSVTTLTTQSTG